VRGGIYIKNTIHTISLFFTHYSGWAIFVQGWPPNDVTRVYCITTTQHYYDDDLGSS
jgi:hypothetical protein